MAFVLYNETAAEKQNNNNNKKHAKSKGSQRIAHHSISGRTLN